MLHGVGLVAAEHQHHMSAFKSKDYTQHHKRCAIHNAFAYTLR